MHHTRRQASRSSLPILAQFGSISLSSSPPILPLQYLASTHNTHCFQFRNASTSGHGLSQTNIGSASKSRDCSLTSTEGGTPFSSCVSTPVVDNEIRPRDFSEMLRNPGPYWSATSSPQTPPNPTPVQYLANLSQRRHHSRDSGGESHSKDEDCTKSSDVGQIPLPGAVEVSVPTPEQNAPTPSPPQQAPKTRKTVKEDALHPKRRTVTDELLSKIMVQEDARMKALEAPISSERAALRTPKDVLQAFSESDFSDPGAARTPSSSAFAVSGAKKPFQSLYATNVQPSPISASATQMPVSHGTQTVRVGADPSTVSPHRGSEVVAPHSSGTTTASAATGKADAVAAATTTSSPPLHQQQQSYDALKHYEEGLYSTVSKKGPVTRYPTPERRTKPTAEETPCHQCPIASIVQQPDYDSLDTTPTIWDVMRRFGHHLWPKDRWDLKGRLVAAFVCVALTKVLKVSVPVIFKMIVDVLVVANPNATAAASAAATSGITTATTSGAAQVAAGTVGLPLIAFVAAYGLTKLSAAFFSEVAPVAFSKIGSTAANEVSMEVFRKLHQLDLAFHNNKTVGGLQKEIERGTRAFGSLAKAILFVMIPTILELTLSSAVLYYHAGLPLVGLAFMSLAAYVLHTIHTSRWRAKFPKAFNRQDTELSKVAVDSLVNYEAVKIFNNEEFEAKRIDRINARINNTVEKIDYSLGVLHFGQQAIFIAAVTTCLAVTTSMVSTGALSIGDMVLIDSLLLQLFAPLTTLGAVYRDASNAAINMQSVLGLLRRKDECEDDGNVPDFVPDCMSIEFRNVSYKVEDKVILDNISFFVPGGSTVAFVGPSGCGKSTIVRMLYRFVEPTEGTILVDGQPLKSVSRESYRRRVSVVPQDTSLFNDTIRHNIRYGNIEASDAEVEEAALAANVHNRIMSFPHGYDTEVGDRGLKLSGGEKQRVAIARCLLKRAPLLLADEFSSALDTHTEGSVMKILKGSNSSSASNPSQSPGGTLSDSIITSVVVAHRLNVIREADIIFVLNQYGQLVESGTHDELMAIVSHPGSSPLSDEAAIIDAGNRQDCRGQYALMHVVDPEEEDDLPGHYRRMWINQNVSPDVSYSRM